MKKTYIAPKAVAYNVNAKCDNLVVTSPQPTSLNGFEEGDGLVKQEESDNVVSIWDLY